MNLRQNERKHATVIGHISVEKVLRPVDGTMVNWAGGLIDSTGLVVLVCSAVL